MLVEPIGALQQGDLVALDYFPVWDLAQIGEFHPAKGSTQLVYPDWPGCLTLEGKSLAVVCAHDCELENPRGRTGLALGPVRKVPASPGSVDFEAILASTEDDPEKGLDWIQLYPVWFPADLEVRSGGNSLDVGAVDFSAITTISRADNAISYLADRRVASMPEAEREKFRFKVGAFFGRDYQDPR